MAARKVELELLKRVLQRNELDVRQVSQIMEDIAKELDKEEEPKATAVKKQFALLGSDPGGRLDGAEVPGWAVQVAAEDEPRAVADRIFRAACEFNATPKGRRFPVQTVGEACETVPARHFKEQGVWVKNKEPVPVIRTDNRIPRETPEE